MIIDNIFCYHYRCYYHRLLFFIVIIFMRIYSFFGKFVSLMFFIGRFSATTAFLSNTDSFSPSISGPINSSYQVMNTRNRCTHRDFQNIGVNGARSGSMNETIKYAIARNQTGDYPALVTIALVGNDVCNGHLDTLADMTTDSEMFDNTMGTLTYLDTVLPAGSSVVLVGLVDGRILYDSMATRIHPIGRLHQDVTYADVYSFLNCLQISPCTGWLNSNETLRNLTSQRAANLSSVLQNIAATQTFKNFKVYYSPDPLAPALQIWYNLGGQAWQLIEPVDGFHPNQYAQPLVTEVFTQWALENIPGVLGSINPYNTIIQTQFGDQGGY